MPFAVEKLEIFMSAMNISEDDDNDVDQDFVDLVMSSSIEQTDIDYHVEMRKIGNARRLVEGDGNE